MANENGGGGGNTALALIVGALLVVVAVGAWYMLAGPGAAPTPSVPEQIDVNVSAPSTGG